MTDRRPRLAMLGHMVRGRKEQLMRRDPLGRQLTSLYRELRHRCDQQPPPATDDLWEKCRVLQAKLAEKYDVRMQIIHPNDWREFSGENFPEAWLEDQNWDLVTNDRGLDSEQPMVATTNMPLPFGLKAIPEFPIPPLASGDREQLLPPPDGAEPSVTFTVNLARVRTWDYERLASKFKDTIRLLRKMMPDDMKQRPSRDSKNQLAFVRTISEDKFQLYLRRYDLHMEQGLTFRQIAALEAMERNGQEPEANRVGKRLKPVRGEDSVEKSVKVIHRAIFRTLYSARRRRLDAPARGARPFSCPDHPGGACNRNCGHLRAWHDEVRRTLPRDSTGRLRVRTRTRSRPKP